MEKVLPRLETLRVHDVMARQVVQIRADQPMSAAAALFAENQITAAPVVDTQGSCVGMLSAADFLKCQAESPNTNALVAAHMTSAIQSVARDALLLTAAEMMDAQHVHRLPVLDEGGRPVGMISTMDVVAALLNAVQEVKARL